MILDNQYNLINIMKINDFEINDSNKIYNQVIKNINDRIILYLWIVNKYLKFNENYWMSYEISFKKCRITEKNNFWLK